FELAPLAEAVRRGDADTVLALLRDDSLQGVHFHAGGLDPLQHDTSRLLAHWRGLADASDPVEALARAGQLRLLAALREGPQGARGLNARIESLLGGRRPSAQRGSAMAGYFHGRLLLVTENSARHRLFNGDVGVCLRDPSGAVLAWFMGGGDARAFHPSTLPAHESAFAMTVHKSQGSEFDEVWLQLPAHDSRVLSRELLYTGLTRARRQVHLFASDDVLRTLLARKAERVTGLTARLT
ncbi:MAG: ATP-binding domain-containing protein, partial [Pseudoxanthomonas sp.]|nr:ATP-binding domain-containing protein [Pseudoxanthomonas sp.]